MVDVELLLNVPGCHVIIHVIVHVSIHDDMAMHLVTIIFRHWKWA